MVCFILYIWFGLILVDASTPISSFGKNFEMIQKNLLDTKFKIKYYLV